jgi:hypothetical protein
LSPFVDKMMGGGQRKEKYGLCETEKWTVVYSIKA